MVDTPPKNHRFSRGQLFALLFIAALFAIGVCQVLSGSRGSVTAAVDDVHLGVCGTYGDATLVRLDAITDVQLIDALTVGTCVDGEETGNTVSGVYRNEAWGKYTINAYTDVPAYILVIYPDGVLVFNCGSASNTEEFFQTLAVSAGKSFSPQQKISNRFS